MSIRDEEIKRLEQYAKGLGLRVEYRQYKPGDSSAELISHDGYAEKIVMYLWPKKSKTQIVLDFVHELAHHLAWIHRDRYDAPKLLEALIAEDARGPKDPPIDKALRKLIYLGEKEDAELRDTIIHEVNIQVPRAKIDMDKLMDLWIYKYYARTGNFPSRALQRKKRKEYASKIQKDS